MIEIKPAPFKGHWFNRRAAREQGFPSGVTVGDLKRFIADLPDDMKVVSINGSEELTQTSRLKVHAMQRYSYYGKDKGIYTFAGEKSRGSGGYDPDRCQPVTKPENVLEI